VVVQVSEGVALGPKNEETPCSNMVMVMGKLSNGQWVCIKNYADAEQLQGVQVLRVVVGPLLFSNAKDFKDHVLQVTEKNHHKGEFIILDCSGKALCSQGGMIRSTCPA
jgi:MFS superfamily sulfate permease-like transporter